MKFAIENPENKLCVLCVLYGYFQESGTGLNPVLRANFIFAG